MIQATQIRRGMLIKIEDVPYVVLSVTHITPGNKRGIIQSTLRNLQTGLSTEMRFRSSDRVEEAEIEPIEMEYIYFADGHYYFMDLESYEQIPLSEELVGDAAKFLQANTKVKVEFYEGKPFGIVLPKYVVLKVIETQAYIKDATAQAQSKPAKLEGGHTCQVPPFIEVGELIKVNTETGEYVERV
ncbi:MAG TPA: elongation factor P [candidate division WOR-3 bacterium]|uniref:Elongation factor P n=1 Tax=candidate division WOR-3 bacterium TaxID=2052148 RepID=A0A9C9EMC3_UNCW3|nr:elongation factor P [candidate division WOR-3 bacterium]